MNKKQILAQLTFGFELEGYFTKKLQDKIGVGAGSWHTDGSVHIRNPYTPENGENSAVAQNSECGNCSGDGGWNQDCDCDYEYNCDNNTATHGHSPDECSYTFACSDNDDYHWETCDDCHGESSANQPATEYSSPILKTKSELLSLLAKFDDKKNYTWGNCCGLHLHIGSKINNFTLQNVACNFKFIQNLQKSALTWCKCQTSRLTKNNPQFYESYPNSEQLVASFAYRQKYRFVRFHPYFNTLEFRFLSPCQHKLANVEKLIDCLVDYLETSETLIETADVNLDQPIKKMTLTPDLSRPMRNEQRILAENQFYVTKIINPIEELL